MKLIVIGAGTPRPAPDRFSSSYLVEIGSERLLFDCGPASTQKLAMAGFMPADIGHLFFTHHHFDHNADYPAFAIARGDQGAGLVPDLRVYGPWPTSEVTDRLFGETGAFAFDIAARINQPPSQLLHQSRGGTLPRECPRFTVRVLEGGESVDAATWTVRSARVEHAQPYLEPPGQLGYRGVLEIGTETRGAVVGLGAIGSIGLRGVAPPNSHVAELQGVELVAGCDPDPTVRRTFLPATGLPTLSAAPTAQDEESR